MTLDYSPFGLKQWGYNDTQAGGNDLAQRWKFGGKEYNDDVVGGNALNWYDISARNYDPALGRWFVIDKMAEKYSEFSPYNYVLNSPILFYDPDGNEPKCCGEAGADRMIRQQISSKLAARDGRPVDVVYQEILDAEGDKTQFAGYAGLGGLVAYIGPEYIVKEAGEAVLEEATGMPFITDAVDIVEQVVKKGLKEGTEKVVKSFDDILGGTTPGRKTKGKNKLRESEVGFEQANKDFDELDLTDVKEIETNYGSGRTGLDADGNTIVVRPGSSDGRATLERRNPNTGRGTEIRYNPIND